LLLQRLINAELITKTMAYEIIFQSTKRSLKTTNLIVKTNDYNEVFIEIAKPSNNGFNCQSICLDKETSIRLAKELRKQISFLED
jgi:hypothetical protein